MYRLWALVFSVVMVLGVFVGCADPAATIRTFTYPPDFKYVSGAELKSTMDALAQDLTRLDLALNAAQRSEAIDEGEVVRILAEIERTAQKLDARSVGSNHPFLEDYMGRFGDTVQQARIAASLNPPNYYLAGRVAGACVSCHKINR